MDTNVLKLGEVIAEINFFNVEHQILCSFVCVRDRAIDVNLSIGDGEAGELGLGSGATGTVAVARF